MSEKTSIDSQLPSQEASECGAPPNQLESLLDISSSTVNTNPEKNLRNQEEVKRIVLQTLEQLQSEFQLGDLNTLTSLIVPKVLIELETFEKLQDEVESIKQSLNSNIQHSKVVSEDIAEIFMDLHNIYSKLEKFEKRKKLKKEMNKKFTKRISEANKFLKSSKHYISNDSCLLAATSETLQSSSTPNFSTPTSTSSRTDEDIPSNDAIRAEKRAFLSNMITVRKSDFSLNLNRNKQFYLDAEKALKSKSQPTED